MNNTKKGMFCILCAAFFFASMNVCVKLAGNLPSIQKSFFRNLIAALFALIILLKNNYFVWNICMAPYRDKVKHVKEIVS